MTVLHVAITRRVSDAFALEAELDLTFQPERPVVGVFGPSGSGKSTLLAALAGLVVPDTGRIALDGTVLCDRAAGVWVAPEARGIGLVPQEGLLFPHLDVRRNLRYGLRRARGRSGPDETRVVDVLELGALLDRRPAGLSGGERQRVALGRALLAAPRLLLLDEPVSALDEDARWRVLSFVERVVVELRVPTLFVSHARTEVLRVTDEAARVEGGRVVEVGPTADVLGEDTADHATWNVLRLEPVGSGADGGDATVSTPIARYAGAEIVLPVPAAPGAPCWCRLSSGAIELELAETGLDHTRSSARNQLSGKIVHVAVVGAGGTAGARVRVVVDVGAGSGADGGTGSGAPLVADVTPGSAERLGLAPGVEVTCRFKAFALEVLK